MLRDAGTAARQELEALLGARVYLETRVGVDPDWQRRAHALDRLGLLKPLVTGPVRVARALKAGDRLRF